MNATDRCKDQEPPPQCEHGYLSEEETCPVCHEIGMEEIKNMKPKTNTKVMVKCHGDGSWLNRFDDNEVAIFKMGRSNATAFDAADKRLEPFVFAPYEILDLP